MPCSLLRKLPIRMGQMYVDPLTDYPSRYTTLVAFAEQCLGLAKTLMLHDQMQKQRDEVAKLRAQVG